MNKVFLYLYPIKEYTMMYLFDDKLYDKWNIKRPLPILNECIQKRYRDKGYQVVFAIYPDRDIFGIIPKKEDKVIYTDVTFEQSSACYENGKIKKEFIPKYPNEKFLIDKLGKVDKLVIGGYHSQDCVKRVGNKALELGIDTMVDLDLTDVFFSIYKEDEYFNIEEYNPKNCKEFILNEMARYYIEMAEEQFNRTYSSQIYGFNTEKAKLKS